MRVINDILEYCSPKARLLRRFRISRATSVATNNRLVPPAAAAIISVKPAPPEVDELDNIGAQVRSDVGVAG